MGEGAEVLERLDRGADPVCLVRPTVLAGPESDALRAQLTARGLLGDRADAAGELAAGWFGDGPLRVEALYVSASGPLLLQFEVPSDLDPDLIERLTGDRELGQLFTPASGFARVLCCNRQTLDALRRYAAGIPRDPFGAAG